MGSRVMVEKFDDFDGSVRADVETIEFSWGGKKFEIDLHAEHVTEMELALLPYIKVAREVKGRKRNKGKQPSAPKVANRTYRWAGEITEYAKSLGYDWDDNEVRRAVRAWALDNGVTKARTGLLPREALDGYHEAQQKGRRVKAKAG